MINCPKCGAEIADTARFCRKCGTRIEEAAAIPEEKETAEFEEPVVAEDGSVDFNWDQPVEIEEPEREEEEPVKDQEPASIEDSSEEYAWGPPIGTDDEPSEMMPVQFEKKEEGIEEYGAGPEYGYEGDGVIPPWDHTHMYDPEDISENKVMAMAAYLLGPIGVIIALIAAQNSPFAGFHVRQSLKFLVVEALVAIVSMLLCWTLIVPAAGAVFLVILLVLRVIAFVSICKGKAVEPPILRSLRFLK